ncbi:MAG: 30S ribosomal protein S16 [Candidatus Pacebacteria bacterium]|nr:30S ribosomal protein S16 [Candidatus Paceibacterota bacterium]
MLTIRLQKFGKKNQPTFRLVIIEKQKSPHGRYIENLGFVDVINKKSSINKDRVIYWLNNGAQVSDSAWNLLVRHKIIEGKKINVLKKKKKSKKNDDNVSQEKKESLKEKQEDKT